MTDFAADDPAWSLEHDVVVRVLARTRGGRGAVAARYTIGLPGNRVIENFPGYSLRPPTTAEIRATFGDRAALFLELLDLRKNAKNRGPSRNGPGNGPRRHAEIGSK